MSDDQTGHTPRAVIAGAGIGGLAAAIGLRRAGWQPVILERYPTPGAIGAGVSLWSNALDALDALGVGEVTRSAGTLQSGGGVRVPDGRWLFRGSGAAMNRSGDALLVMHRAELHRELLAALPAGTVIPGATVTGVEHVGDGVVVGYDAPTGREEARCDLLVGADGIHSTVRQKVWLEAPAPIYAGFTAWRGVTDEPVDVEESTETWGVGAEFGVVPLADQRVYWFGTANLPEGTTFGDERAEVLRRFGQWHHPVTTVVRATTPSAVLHHDIYHLPRPLPRFSCGAVVLLGDAAHAMTPNLGQGACLALEDAVVLAACLAADTDVERALLRYDEQRRPRAEDLVKMSAQMGRMIQLENRAAVVLRNLMVRATPERHALARIARITNWTPPEISRDEHGRETA